MIAAASCVGSKLYFNVVTVRGHTFMTSISGIFSGMRYTRQFHHNNNPSERVYIHAFRKVINQPFGCLVSAVPAPHHAALNQLLYRHHRPRPPTAAPPQSTCPTSCRESPAPVTGSCLSPRCVGLLIIDRSQLVSMLC